MKIDLIADTNFIIYVSEGNRIVKPFLDFSFGISFISEIELLGFKNATKSELAILKSIINDTHLAGWNDKIKDATISLRRNYNIKLPDAIIAATALSYNIPLVTADKGFKQIKELELILFEV